MSRRLSKLPHNNRMSSSSALRTNDIWSKTIGYDPYANDGDAAVAAEKAAAAAEQQASLLLLAKMQNVSGERNEEGLIRGACKRCNTVGHLTFQCRNAPWVPPSQMVTYIVNVYIYIYVY